MLSFLGMYSHTEIRTEVGDGDERFRKREWGENSGGEGRIFFSSREGWEGDGTGAAQLFFHCRPREKQHTSREAPANYRKVLQIDTAGKTRQAHQATQSTARQTNERARLL